MYAKIPDVFNLVRKNQLDPLDIALCIEKLKSETNVDVVTRYNRTLLMTACMKNSIPWIQMLIDAGADLNLIDNGGRTALMLACEWGNTESVKILLEQGAKTDIVDIYQTTALMVACESSRTDKELVKFLLDHGARADIELDGQSPLTLARDFQNQHVVDLIESYLGEKSNG